MFEGFAAIQTATRAARNRLGRRGIGAQLHKGKYQVVDVQYAGRKTVVTPLSDWLAPDAVVAALDALDLPKRHTLYGRSFAIAAEFVENEEGIKAANDYMVANPGHGLLDIVDGRVIVASCADKGTKV